MFFKCRVCEEKDKRIADLKAQLLQQTNLLQSVISPQYSKAVELEANRALEGLGTPQVDLNEDQKEQISAVERQALELLTGQYN